MTISIDILGRKLTVLAFDLGDTSNVTSSKGVGRLDQQEEQGDPQQQGSWFKEGHGGDLHYDALNNVNFQTVR